MRFTTLLALTAFVGVLGHETHAADSPLIPEEIKAEIHKRVDLLYSTAIVVGVSDTNGTSFYSYGSRDLEGGGAVNEDTIFEIAGVSKVLTATLLSDMAMKGELSLTNLIQDYLPSGRMGPVFGAEQTGLRFLDLATHKSGLPADPMDLTTSTTEQVYDFLENYNLTTKPGGTYEFSNYGFALLGQILADWKGVDFETLLRQRLIDVLGLKDTLLQMSPPQESRFATRYSGVVRCPPMEMGASGPSLGVRSTARDLLRFAGANAGVIETSLYSAMTNAQAARFLVPDRTRIGLGWYTRTAGAVSVVEYSGNLSFALNCYVGLIPGEKRAVVALATGDNCAEDLGRNLLSAAFPMKVYPKPTQVPTQVLRHYVGTYTLPGHTIQIAYEHGHLTFLWSGDGFWFTLYPAKSSRNNRFLMPPAYSDATVGTSSVTFNYSASGEVESLTWIALLGSATVPKESSGSMPPELCLNRTQAGCDLELIGDLGSDYRIEWSSDLRTWAPLIQHSADSGSLQVLRTEPMRFYRARE